MKQIKYTATLWEVLRASMLSAPGQTMSEDQASMTYEEVIVYAEILAKRLVGQHSCGVYCHSEMATALALLGCFSAGVTAVPVSPRYGLTHCKRILQEISPTCIITDIHGALEVYLITDSQYKTPPEKPALILCTSGTTGTPKGVMLSQQNLISNATAITHYFMLGKQDTILITRPLYHGGVLTGEFLTALLQGANICFYSGKFSPGIIAGLMERHSVTAFGGTPTTLFTLSRYLLKRTPLSIRHVTISGEVLNLSVSRTIRQAFPNAKIYHGYGLTEASPRVCYLPPELFDTCADCVGIPLESVKIRILNDKTGSPVPKGQPGILWVKGDNVMMGYHNNPQLTKTVCVKGWLCTGDIAVLQKNGLLRILGRKDDMIIRAGMNIYPQEIENVVLSDSRSREVLVYGEPDERCGMRIVLQIAGDFSSKQEVQELCTRNLSPYQMPTVIELVDEIPKNATGKTQRKKPTSKGAV